MDDVALDYGDPSELQGDVALEEGGMKEEEGLDAEMRDWANQYDGDMEYFQESREKKMQELKQERMGTKFYPLPKEEGITAGANRGISSQIDLDDVELLGPEEDLPLPETPVTIGGGQDIRYNVLHLSGSPVTQCSTSRLFAYITHYGAQPLGLEWINDSSCNIVFSDSSAARLAIEYLCPAVSTSYDPLIPLPNDQTLDEAVNRKKRLDNPEAVEQSDNDSNQEWSPILLQSLLTNRKAHRVPAKLYNAPERDAAAAIREVEQQNSSGQSKSTLPEDVPEIYREMEAEDRRKELMKPEQVNLQRLRGTLWIRWALESMDVKPSKAAKQSKWYREHGNDAGKEVVTKLLDVGGLNDRLELLPSNGTDRRKAANDRNRWDDSAEVSRGRGNRQAAMDVLDADLDSWRATEEIEADVAKGGEAGEQPRQRFQRRRDRGRGGQMTMESLDEELERDQRDRSASPIRIQSDYRRSTADNGRVKVKGRGRMKAPSAWDDEVDNGHDGTSMVADRYAGGRRGDNRRRRGYYHHDQGDNLNQTLEQRLSQSLEQRLQGGHGGSDLLDRMG